MLFSSHEFIFVFLPLALAGFYWVAGGRPRLALNWLTLASLAFYGWWDLGYLAVLIGLIAVNIGFAWLMLPGDRARRRRVRNVGVVFNLGVLIYFKYAAFMAANLATATGWAVAVPSVALPLGISFFTFQKIAFLVDAERRPVEDFTVERFLLFVTFFPQLIAGPIVHHSDVFPQFASREFGRYRDEFLAVGLTVFAFGLFKKAVLADSLAPAANSVFDSAAAGQTFGFLPSTAGALAYTMQLYFDFSGYSDMAIGLAAMFGIRLPINFHSPYRATSIIEFWRRWHMTLSRLLREYVYVPLGGNRRGEARRFVNLFLTMLIGGVWHGAGWTFVAWGALHGFYLAANHALRAAFPRRGEPGPVARAGGWGVTFICVVVGWVFFRAASLDVAFALLADMAGLNGIGRFEGNAFQVAIGEPIVRGRDLALIAIASAIAFLAPNVREVMGARFPGLVDTRAPAARPVRAAFAWTPTIRTAAAVAALMVAGIVYASGVSEFIYFQF